MESEKPNGSSREPQDGSWVRYDDDAIDPLPDTDTLVEPAWRILRGRAECDLDTLVSSVGLPDLTPAGRELLGTRLDEALSFLDEQGYATSVGHRTWKLTARGLSASEDEVANLWTSTFSPSRLPPQSRVSQPAVPVGAETESSDDDTKGRFGLIAAGVFLAAALFFTWQAYQRSDFNRHALEATAEVRSIGDCTGPGHDGPPTLKCRVSAVLFFPRYGHRTVEWVRADMQTLRWIDESRILVTYDRRDPTRLYLAPPDAVSSVFWAVGLAVLAVLNGIKPAWWRLHGRTWRTPRTAWG